jgi:hypothetical protein
MDPAFDRCSKTVDFVGGPSGPILADFFSVKKMVEFGELVGLIGLIAISIKDIIKIVWR